MYFWCAFADSSVAYSHIVSFCMYHNRYTTKNTFKFKSPLGFIFLPLYCFSSSFSFKQQVLNHIFLRPAPIKYKTKPVAAHRDCAGLIIILIIGPVYTVLTAGFRNHGDGLSLQKPLTFKKKITCFPLRF